MNTALLIIDVQNDYFEHGKMELNKSFEGACKIKNVLDYFRKNSMPIIHIQHISNREGATFFLPNTFGVEIYEDVKPSKNEKVIIKNYPNSFRDTELNQYLRTCLKSKNLPINFI